MAGDAIKRQRLSQLAAEAETRYVTELDRARLLGQAPPPVRHKCFLSYHGADIDAVTTFVEGFSDVFIPRVVGVSDSDYFQDPISSDDEKYIKEQIGKRYLADSTVTILYVGACSWARKYIDWELSSSMFDGKINKRNGLMATLPPGESSGEPPSRFVDNWEITDGVQSGYARFYKYPATKNSLRNWIEDAFGARKSRSEFIDNSRKLRERNSPC